MVTEPVSPKWATPDRQNCLVRLFVRSKGFCVFGHIQCPYPDHYYDVFIETLIKEWVSDDKAQDLAEWQAELKALHRTADRTEPVRGRFSAVSRDIWHDRQPLYYLDGYGISGLLLKPFAKVRIAGGYVTLFINLGDTLKAGVSKSQRRKAIRYGKPLPLPVQEQVRQKVVKAVLDYLNH